MQYRYAKFIAARHLQSAGERNVRRKIMGVATAGIAFKSSISSKDLTKLVEKLVKTRVVEILHPNFREFDVRNKSDIMVSVFEDSYFIDNHDLTWDLLGEKETDISELYFNLGSPELIIAYCQYESGGSFGYAFFEKGVKTRSRLQTTGVPNLPPVVEYGIPKETEMNWLNGKTYLEEDECPEDERQRIFVNLSNSNEVAEYFLTSRILLDVFLENFNVCPWDTEIKPIYHFYRISEKKPWWKVLFS